MQNKCNVVMLPTVNENRSISQIYKFIREPVNIFDKRIAGELTKTGSPNQSEYQCQHLYIISDEEIKDGDYGFINIGKSGTIGKVSYDSKYNTWDLTTFDNIHYPFTEKTYIKKIIATTDTSLKIINLSDLGENWKDILLPSLSQQFIQQYIEEYNKGNITKEVWVEYEGYVQSTTWEYDEPEGYRVKINSDNTINIKPIKDSWSREEVIELLHKYERDMTYFGRDSYYKGCFPKVTDDWANENL